MPKFLDLTNQVFGKLTVIKRYTETTNKDVTWECLCECGNLSYPTTDNLRKKNGTKSCGCSWKIRGKSHCRWKGYEEISGRYWYVLQSNAKNRNIEFNITIEYIWELFLKQNRQCALTKLPINVIHCGDNRNRHYSTASLDRIDSYKGYIEGNVQWVSKKVNQIKMDLTNDDFIGICNLVSKNNPKDETELDKFIATNNWLEIRRKTNG